MVMWSWWHLACSVTGPQAVALKEDGLRSAVSVVICLEDVCTPRLWHAHQVPEIHHSAIGDLQGKRKHGL